MNKSLFLRIAIILSLIMHICAGLLIYFFPAEKKEHGKPFITRLVSPDELPAPSREKRSERAEVPSVKSPPPSIKIPGRMRAAKPSILPERREVPQIAPRQLQPLPPTQNSEKAGAENSKSAPSEPSLPNEGLESKEGSESFPHQAFSGSGGISRPPPTTLKEKLFDKEVVEKLAKREEVKKDNTITFDTDEFKYRTYMLRLKEKIESVWQYPPEAAMAGIYGDLTIRFTIKKNGMLGDIELLRTSGHKNLDDAAREALKAAQPYWPLPNEWGKDNLTITGHFVYSLYGTYIR
ncbi:MAG TPA: energy transducer TonB [Nitrospiraceae bacterium]|nr:energy transducer TonB [Nitrospiraceae bacterium]